MAQIQNPNHKTKPKRSCFSSCFRISPEIPDPDGNKSPENIRSSSRRKIRWFSRSRFRINKSGTKTVPVDASIADKATIEEEIEALNSGKITNKRQIPVVAAAASDQMVKDKPPKAKYGTVQSTILETRKPLDPLASMKDNTCQKKLPADRKTESKMTGRSHPNSPENKPKTSKKAMISFPPANPPKPPVQVRKKSDKENDTSSGKFDPIVGMSIMILTLAIMLMWGKICAIVCTSAWFFFISRLRSVANSEVIADKISYSSNSGLNSESYKKKVILEGLLERNHRNLIGIL